MSSEPPGQPPVRIRIHGLDAVRGGALLLAGYFGHMMREHRPIDGPAVNRPVVPC